MPSVVKELQDSTSDSLPAALAHAEQLVASLQTHAAFLRVQTLEDTTNQDAKRARDQVNTDRSVVEAAEESRLRLVPPSQILSLGKYAFLAQSVQKDSAHLLSPDTERYRGMVVSPGLQAIADDYDRIDATLKRPQAVSSTDTTARRAAITEWNDEFNRAAPEEAALLGVLVELENRDAEAEHYSNAADRKYLELGLDEKTIQQTLTAVQSEAGVYRQYQQVLAQHVAHTLGVPAALSSEVGMVTTHADPISLDDARSMILTSLQPLGTDYTQRFARLLDPANGRFDLTGGAHRANAGTSISAYNAPTALYFNGYHGSLGNVSTLAHEGGHAIHREIMNDAGLPIYERSGPHYMFEAFAIFNELLVLNHAVDTAKTSQQKEDALQRLLAKIALELFVSAEEASFERSLYVSAKGQGLLDHKKVDALYQASIAPYETWDMADIGQSRGWMEKSLVFEDPLYLVNYLYASVIAVALYEHSQSDPDFASKYEALLRRGFDAPPQELLKTMNIRLDDPTLIRPAAQMLKEKTEELEKLYLSQNAH